MLGLELREQPLHHGLVEVLASQIGVAVGSDHVELVALRPHHRDVEGAAAQVVHRQGEVLGLAVAVRERRRGRLVDQAQHLDARVLGRELGGLALHVVEVRGDRDHGAADGLAQDLAGLLDDRLEDACGDLHRCQLAASDLEHDRTQRARDDRIRRPGDRGLDLGRLEGVADQALDRGDGILRIGHELATRGLADDLLAVLDGQDGRDRPVLSFSQHQSLAVFDDGDAAVDGAEVDTENA